MKHLYQIEDPLEIKLIVLHTLSQAPQPLTMTQLTDLILNSAEINYFSLLSAIDFLIDVKEVFTYKSMEDTYVYELTKEGQSSAQHFYMRIPLEIRDYIAEGIADLFELQRQKRQLRTEVIPVSYHTFSAKCELCDTDLPLLELTLYTGDRKQAEQVCKTFQKHHANIYHSIVSMLIQHNPEKG